MTPGALLALGLAGAALVYVLAPLFRADAGQQERRARKLSEEEELVSEREMALAALKDLEDDHATGKIAEADYGTFKEKLTLRAAAVLRRLDEIEAQKARPRPELVSPRHPGAGS